MEPVAIIGYGCVYPNQINTTQKFWKMVLNGDICVKEIPDDRWDWRLYYSADRSKVDKTYSKYAACIENYQLSPAYKELLAEDKLTFNRTQTMIYDTICQALEKTQYDGKSIGKTVTSFFLGNMLGDDAFANYSLWLRGKEVLDSIDNASDRLELNKEKVDKMKTDVMSEIEKKFPPLDASQPEKYIGSYLALAIKEAFELKGISTIIDGACSSSILALDEAIKSLHSKEEDMCIVSGALGSVNVIGSVGFSKIGGLAEQYGHPLDENTTGLNLSEGVGTIIIKRLKDAKRDNDKIYGVITGIGSSNNGAGKSIYSSSVNGQYDAMKKALGSAGIASSELDYIETHATGTPAGDVVELQSIHKLFEENQQTQKTVAIGNLKRQIGHSFSAAGMANVIKVLESFSHNIMPPTWGFKALPKDCTLDDTPLYLNLEQKEWIKESNLPKRTLINAFGFGGVNSSAILEEYLPKFDYKDDKDAIDYSKLDVSIVAMGVIDGKFTGKEHWNQERYNEVSGSKHYPDNRWNERIAKLYDNYLEEGWFIPTINFPCLKFRTPPKIISQLDRSQTIALLAADEAIKEYGEKTLRGSNTSVYVAKFMGTEKCCDVNIRVRVQEYIKCLKETTYFNELDSESQNTIIDQIRQDLSEYVPQVEEDCLPGYMDNIVSGRISNFFDLRGSSMVIDSGSDSFSLALRHGIDDLILGKSEHVLVGGMSTNMAPEQLSLYSAYMEKRLPENERQAYIPCEGAIFYVLKKTEDVTPEEHVYARIISVQDEEFEVIKAYGNENLEHMNYKISNKEPYYFGADMGFRLLDGMKHLEKLKEQMLPTSVWIKDTPIVGGEFKVRLVDKDYDLTKEIEEAKEEDNLMDEEGIVNIEPYHILAITADSSEELLERCKEINKTNYRTIKRTPKEWKEYRISIVYQEWNDLEKKLRLVLNNK